MNKLFFRLQEFFKESWQELKRVNWPTKKETIRYTLTVLAFSVIVAISLSFIDFGFIRVIRLLLIR